MSGNRKSRQPSRRKVGENIKFFACRETLHLQLFCGTAPLLKAKKKENRWGDHKKKNHFVSGGGQTRSRNQNDGTNANRSTKKTTEVVNDIGVSCETGEREEGVFFPSETYPGFLERAGWD